MSYEEEDTYVGHVHSRVIIAHMTHGNDGSCRVMIAIENLTSATMYPPPHMTHGNDGSCRVMIAIENLSNIQHNAMVYIANN